jgi:cytochrome c oxidase subunit 1
MAYVAIADRDNEQELHDPDTFITKYVWSQDHKVIAIQYSIIAIAVGLIAFRMHLRLSIPPLITSLLRCTA